jgi:hypothetical protein
MIIDHQVLEHGDFGQRQQVVKWVRRFPFSFISDREYTLARRVFREGPKVYGITKVRGMRAMAALKRRPLKMRAPLRLKMCTARGK